MSLTDQELESFLEEVGVFSGEKLDSLLEVRERPQIPAPPIEKPKSKRLFFFGTLTAAFILGLSIGVTLTYSNKKEVGQQLTYIIQKISELENSRDLIEPISIPSQEVL